MPDPREWTPGKVSIGDRLSDQLSHVDDQTGTGLALGSPGARISSTRRTASFSRLYRPRGRPVKDQPDDLAAFRRVSTAVPARYLPGGKAGIWRRQPNLGV